METSRIVASDIMTTRLTTTSPENHILNAIDQIVDHGVSGLPVIDHNHSFVGQFSERSGISALDLTKDSLSQSDEADPLDRLVIAADIMKQPELVLNSGEDVFQSIDRLLHHHVSGAAVVDFNGVVQGTFSEQSAMRVFIGLCWEQMPSSQVSAWLDRNPVRCIEESTPLSTIFQIFQENSFRRLLVVRDNKLVGEITRRDALVAAVDISRGPLMSSRDVKGAEQLGFKTHVDFWMKTEVPTITESVDVLTIAQMFIHSSARQLPVLENMLLTGQVSRSDLLRAVQKFLPEYKQSAGAQPLYLSTVRARQSVSMLN